jgi:hypothetical protein
LTALGTIEHREKIIYHYLCMRVKNLPDHTPVNLVIAMKNKMQLLTSKIS